MTSEQRDAGAFLDRMGDDDRVPTLHGVDGEKRSGVRYADIYEVRDGLIHRVDIYNDLAVDGVVEP